MAIKHTEYWTERAKCNGCQQYIWSNPGSGSVICSCGTGEIQNHVRISGDIVVNEVDFEQWGSADLGYEFGEVLFVFEQPA